MMPGDYVQYSNTALNEYEGEEIAIEPSNQTTQNWLVPSISRVVRGTVRIPNMSADPVHLPRSLHVANIRRVIDSPVDQCIVSKPAVLCSVTVPTTPKLHSASVQLDPAGQLSREDRERFRTMHSKYDAAFDPVISTYNDKFGIVRSKVYMGPVLPPPHKGRIPMYDQAKLQMLQDEADKMEQLGILAPPADVGVDHVLHVSPSFLVKKPGGPETGHRYLTAFNELGQYTRILPTLTRSCDEVIRKLASFKYIIKCDLTKNLRLTLTLAILGR